MNIISGNPIHNNVFHRMGNVISGEKIQDLTDIYLGVPDDFKYNPYINRQNNKQKNILEINSNYNNPKIIFCYSHRIDVLSKKINYFLNNFILITHNSDKNIINEDLNVQKIYNCNKLIKWFTQNLCFNHNKIYFLPIGIANQQWEHGHLFNEFYNYYINDMNKYKKINKSIYFFFEINTNLEKRKKCFDTLIPKIKFLNKTTPMDNYIRMSNYEFCICPEGNGIDTHRFWESLYLNCVPIVIENPLTILLHNKTNLPMIMLKSWDEFDINKLPDYKTFNFFNSSQYLNINFYKENIINLCTFKTQIDL